MLSQPSEFKKSIVSCGEIPECFDAEYYYDQLDPEKRRRYINTQKVTKEFMEQESAKLKSIANKEARILSAKGMTAMKQMEEVGHFLGLLWMILKL